MILTTLTLAFRIVFDTLRNVGLRPTAAASLEVVGERANPSSPYTRLLACRLCPKPKPELLGPAVSLSLSSISLTSSWLEFNSVETSEASDSNRCIQGRGSNWSFLCGVKSPKSYSSRGSIWYVLVGSAKVPSPEAACTSRTDNVSSRLLFQLRRLERPSKLGEMGEAEGEGVLLSMAVEVEIAELCRLWVAGIPASSVYLPSALAEFEEVHNALLQC